MKQLEIKLPTTLSACTPEQMTRWLMMAEAMKEQRDDDITQLLIFQCQLLSLFSGESINKIKRADIESIQVAANHLLQLLVTYKYQEPQSEIEINGKAYCFEKNFGYVSTGQIIDLKLIEDISQDPCQALAIMYVEKGMEYCQEDDRGRVLNPNEVRYKEFKENFPGDEFLNFFSFFLDLSEKRKLAILGIQMARQRMEMMMMEQDLKIQSGSVGQLSYIDYPKKWESVWQRLHNSLM
jgi:hypothetical protein